MSNSQLQRKTINRIEDLTEGAGLGAKIKSINVNSLKVGRYYGGDNAGYMDACVSIEIEYEAGYTIGSDYVYSSTGEIGDTSLIDNVRYARNGEFDFDIKYLKEDYLPFKNWWVEVDSDESLLTEIIDVGADSYGDDDDRDNCIGEAFSFSYDESCREVAYSMLSNLSTAERSNKGSPFTDEFVAEINKQVREAIANKFIAVS